MTDQIMANIKKLEEEGWCVDCNLDEADGCEEGYTLYYEAIINEAENRKEASR